MNKSHLPVLTWIAIFFLLCCPAYGMAADQWVSFNGAVSSSSVEITTPVSGSKEFVIDMVIPGMTVTERMEQGVTYQQMEIAGAGHTSRIGEPQLPMISRYVAVPAGATPRVEVVSHDTTVFDGYQVYPAQAPRADVADASPPAFAMDRSTYSSDSYHPTPIARLEGPYVIRGRTVNLLQVFPVQYNPVQHRLRANSRIRIRIAFEGGQFQGDNGRLRSPAYDNLFNRLLLNAASSETAPPADAAYHAGNLLLIITHPDFQASAQTLATWKREKGIHTEVRNTDQTGNTAADIQSYIKKAYDTWNPAPSYVMLIGDAEFIPTHYVTTHPYGGDQGRVGTDLYYATVDGSDYFPDISTGRISVDTPAQASKRINDIIAYERTPVMQRSYYQNIALCGYFQHANSGFADRRFAQTLEDLALFFSDADFLGDYTVDRIYFAQSSVHPRYWSNPSWNFGGGPAGDPGDPIPMHLRKDVPPFYQWDGDAADISNAVNSGRFLVTHRDHGSRTSWGEPSYSTSHIKALTNGDMLPVVWSVNCQTGWFDNETDDSALTSPSEVNFTEAWERNADGGAVGLIGATRVSFSGHNDRLMWGWTDAIWPAFMTYSPSGTPFDNPLWEMGPVLNYGKYYYATLYSDSIYRQTQFEIFHWYGDPTMEIWTADPRSLTVAHDVALTAGQTSLDVKVSPCDGALICITKDGRILGKGSTTGGSSTITWATPLKDGDQILVTVTGHNYRPYQGTAGTLDVCECDLDHDSDCDISDWYNFIREWGRNDCNSAGADACACDINHDGTCDMIDWGLFRPDWGRTDCPISSPQNLRITDFPLG